MHKYRLCCLLALVVCGGLVPGVCDIRCLVVWVGDLVCRFGWWV